MTKPKIDRVLWAEGTELWLVPGRFWEDYKPIRCVVVRDDGKYNFEGMRDLSTRVKNYPSAQIH